VGLAPAQKKPEHAPAAKSEPVVQKACATCASAPAVPGTPKYMQAKSTMDKGAGADLGGRNAISIASTGVADSIQPLPHLAKIQASFGAHDVSGVKTSIGGTASTAASELGARAYTVGDRVGFREEPDLHLAAHEAAHVVQQRAGVQLAGGVGAPGDRYEHQADAVADAVVAGHSAEALLGPPNKSGGATGVQMACASCGGSGCGCNQPALQMELDPLATREYDGAAIVGGGAPAVTGPAKADAKAAAKAPPATEAAPTEKAAEKSEDDPISKIGALLGQAVCPTIPEPPKAKAPEGEEDKETCVEDADYFKPITPEQRALDEQRAKDGELKSPGEPKGVDVKAESAAESTPPDKSADGAKPKDPEPPKECADEKKDPPPPTPPPAEAPAEPMPEPPGQDPQLAESILIGEERRAAAIADFDLATSEGSTADGRLLDLASESFRFSPPSEDLDAQKNNARATEIASRAIADGVREAHRSVSELRPQVAQRIAMRLAQSKRDVDLACDQAKDVIRSEFAGARAAAQREAALSGLVVDLSFVSAMVASVVAAVTTAAAIDAEKTTQVAEAQSIGTAKQGELDAAVAAGQKTVRAVGTDRGEDAMKKGRSWYGSYGAGRPFPKDGFWEGYVTDRRAEARQKASLTTAAGYRDSFKQEAENQASNVARGKAAKCARIVATTFATRVGIGTNGAKFAKLVTDSLPGQIESLQSARTEFRAAIQKQLDRQLLTLSYQESAQLQAAEDTSYAQKLTLEQQAHAAVTRLQRSISKANADVARAFIAVRETIADREAPDEKALSTAMDAARASVRQTLARMRGDVAGGIEASESSLDEQAFASGESLAQLGEGAAASARESSAGFAESQGALRGRIGESFTALSGAYGKQCEAIQAAATKAFACAIASLNQVADTSIKEVETGAKSIADSLDKSFNEELGKVDAKIQDAACKAAEKEQPAWKEILVAILIVVVIIIAIVAFGPLALALSGGVAISMAGAIAAGAIIGMLSAAATTILSNWGDGQKWHKGVVKAMVVGAITGAIGGAFGGGAAGGWVGKATTFVGAIGRQVIADVVGSMIGQVLGGLIVDGRLQLPHYSVKDFMMSVFMAALFAKGKIPKRMGEGASVRAKAVRGFEKVQDFAHGVAGSFMPGGRFRPTAKGEHGAPPAEAGRPGETAPTKPTEVAPSRPNEKPSAPEPRKAEAAAEHGKPGERPEVARPESLHDARAKERSAHHDTPEVEAGSKVVAKEPSVGDHTVSVTKDGKVVVCSTCGELALVFEPEIHEFGLQKEIVQIEAMTNPQAKAAAAARLHARLVKLRALTNGTLAAPDPTGSLSKISSAAAEMKISEAQIAHDVQSLIKSGRHPRNVPPEGQYGQKLLEIAEGIAGPRTEPARPVSIDDVILAKKDADAVIRAEQVERGKAIGADRLAGEKGGPKLSGARDQIADVVVNPLEQGVTSVTRGKKVLDQRVSQSNEGNKVVETIGGKTNMIVEGNLGTYQHIEAVANAHAAKLGMTPRQFIEVFIQAIQTGKTPKVSGRSSVQGVTGRFISRLQRLVFGSEVVRSQTQISDMAHVLEIMLDAHSFAPLREMMPTASTSTEGTPQVSPEAGGAAGARRATERAEGARPGDNATDRAADTAIGRHYEIIRRLPRYANMTRAQMRDAFIRDIRQMIFGEK